MLGSGATGALFTGVLSKEIEDIEFLTQLVGQDGDYLTEFF